MNLSSFMTANFFKPRTVLCAEASSYRVRGRPSGDVRVERWAAADALPEGLHGELSDGMDAAVLNCRRRDARCALYTATDEQAGRLAGFYWSVRPGREAVWHDKVCVSPGTSLLFNAYVRPAFRRRGVYTHLIAAAHDHLLGGGRCARVFTVVEDQNTASMRANVGFGLRPCMRNYLIKIAGRTVFSVFLKRDGLEVHYVIRNAKGHRL